MRYFSDSPLRLGSVIRHEPLHRLACSSTEIYERQMHLAKYEDMLADHCKKALSGPSHPCPKAQAPSSINPKP